MENIQELPLLDFSELRVLGALMEKAMTTPDYYPMTLNGLTNACNQKSARKPVVEFDEETVVLALNSLKKKALVSNETGGLSRVAKYKHNFAIVFRTVPSELAIMCLLLLRGPQTPGELKTNANRMYNFETLEEVNETLQALTQYQAPLVVQLPRKAGQKEQRYAHLLGGELIHEEDDVAEEPARKSVNELELRVLQVEQELAELKAAFDKLMKELMG